MINQAPIVRYTASVCELFFSGFSKKTFSAESILILLKTPLLFFSFFRLLAGEPQFVAGIDFPLHHFSRFDINGGRQGEGEIHIALGDALFAPDGLNLGQILHGGILVY